MRVAKALNSRALAAALLALSLAAPLSPSQAAPATPAAKYLETPPGRLPRVVITTDAELDDRNSLVRYMLMSDGYKTEGLIYSSSKFHWMGDGKGTKAFVKGREYDKPELSICPCDHYRWDPDQRFVDDVVDAYAKAYPNLKVHDKNYPTPAYMRSKVKWGNVDFDGEMDHDTDGSNLIKALLLDNVNEPVYLHAWGGLNTIGRALKSIEDQYKGTPQWPAIRAKVIAKAVIHPSGDQDDVGANYIRPNWPDIRYGNGGGATASLGFSPLPGAAPADQIYYSADWMAKYVVGKGPLGALERVWGEGKPLTRDKDIFDYFHLDGYTSDQLKAMGYQVWTPPRPRGEFLGEGDTPTFLSLLDNGLEGWRQENRRNPAVYQTAEPAPAAAGAGRGAAPASARGPAPPRTSNRYVAVVMNDLAGRLAWSVTPKYADANHYPAVSVKSPKISAKPGETVTLTATASDPDKNTVALSWYRFEGNGTYAGAIALDKSDGPATSFRVPDDAKSGDTIHIIVQATDNGMIPLSRFARTVVTVK
ncbi:MAG: hypothetical protein JWM33_282 [Caulobacteraceae bacterium]|nr:hypothetical protein [Caulobacteraceae bacterium]